MNALMENRHRIVLGIGTAVGHGSTVKEEGCLGLVDRAKRWLRVRIDSLGADKGFFHVRFIAGLLRRGIEPHVVPTTVGRRRWHTQVRMRLRGEPYRLSQRCRKKIPEENRGVVRRSQGLARVAAVPAAGPAAGAPGRP